MDNFEALEGTEATLTDANTSVVEKSTDEYIDELDNLSTGGDGSDVVANDGDETSDSEVDTEEVADPQDGKQKQQSPEDNAMYRKMRLKAEEDARKKIEAERRELQRMKQEIEEERSAKKVRDEYITQEKIEAKAYEEGVSETIARKLLSMEADKLMEAEKQKVRERFNQVEAMKKQLQADEFYAEISPKMEDILDKRPDLNPDTVYYYLKGQMGKELYEKATKNAEKRTIANVQDSMRRKVVPNQGAAGNDTLTTLSSEGMEMANAFGVDPRELAKYVKEKQKLRR